MDATARRGADESGAANYGTVGTGRCHMPGGGDAKNASDKGERRG